MPARYHPVSPAVWDRTFRRQSKEAKIVALYVWTGPARCSEGLYRAPIGYVVNDTGLSEDEVKSALKELADAGLVSYDAGSETILDRVALRWNPLKNTIRKKDSKDGPAGEVVADKRMRGAIRQLEALTDSPLLHEFAIIASRFSPDFAVELYEHFPFLKRPGLDVVRPLQGAFCKSLRSPSEGTSREE